MTPVSAQALSDVSARLEGHGPVRRRLTSPGPSPATQTNLDQAGRTFIFSTVRTASWVGRQNEARSCAAIAVFPQPFVPRNLCHSLWHFSIDRRLCKVALHDFGIDSGGGADAAGACAVTAVVPGVLGFGQHLGGAFGIAEGEQVSVQGELQRDLPR